MDTISRGEPRIQGFVAADDDRIDYVSDDHRTVIELKQSSPGVRGLRTGLLQLARFLDEHPSVERGCLLLNRSRLSRERLQEEWCATKGVLKKSVSRRLGIIAFEENFQWIDPKDGELQSIAAKFEPHLTSSSADTRWHSEGTVIRPTRPQRKYALPRRPGQKFYEIAKVLISRWLQKMGPIAIGELARQVGCSYPTVSAALKRSSLRRAASHLSNRSVELRAFPHETWSELVALSSTMRPTFRFQDRSGDKRSPQSLLKRLERNTVSHLAVGGVIAARHWHPGIDLHGIPRLDLLYHSCDKRLDLTFVEKLDPALELVDDGLSADLVVHVIQRSMPLFVKPNPNGVSLADPVETALDLCELSLIPQADRLLTHLRPEVRLP